MDYKIDFVIPWVDGSDPKWLDEKKAYSPTADEDAREIRFRDWGLLRYWFRAVEENAPWVNKIFFVTWGHLPEWLNVENKKLVIVNHKDYIPEKYLPTFSSHVIELNFHRISELSEHFVYFNDDVYIIGKVKPEDFFVDGLPCDCLIENPITPLEGGFSSILCEMGAVINKHFRKSDLKSLGWKKYLNPVYKGLILRTMSMRRFSNIMGFYNHHISQPHLKSTFDEVWNEEYEKLDETCKNRFRGKNDVNQYIFRYWNLCKGIFFPKYPMGRNIKMTEDINYITEVVTKGRYKIITINDVDGLNDIECRKQMIDNAFHNRYPNKCSFER